MLPHCFPTMGGRDRRPQEDGPTLGAQVLMQTIMALPFVQKLVGARVVYKKNVRGEHVVAVVFPSQPP
jgi:hypothetical protein